MIPSRIQRQLAGIDIELGYDGIAKAQRQPVYPPHPNRLLPRRIENRPPTQRRTRHALRPHPAADPCSQISRSELVHLVLGVPELLEDPADRALLRALLLPRDRGDLAGRAYIALWTIGQSEVAGGRGDRGGRGGRTADEDFDFVVEGRGREVLLEHVFGQESGVT